MVMGSAGKFITYIAALQLVDQGLVRLDDPVYNHLPELEKLEIISADDTPGSQGFTLRPRTKDITLRQMVTHSSGIPGEDIPLIEAWRKVTVQEFPEDAPMIVKRFSAPLMCEPGEGWHYGHSVHWLQVFVERASKQKFVSYVHEHIFTPLGMNSATYISSDRQDVRSKMLQMVRRDKDGSLVPAPGNDGGLTWSMANIQAVLADLISPEPKILKKETLEVFFQPQFAPTSAALKALRADTENYEAPAGITAGTINPPVNYSAGGLVVEETLPLSQFPAGTVTWNGFANTVWALNRERGLGMFIGTQLFPVDDEKTVALMMEFLKGVWAKFG